MGAALAAALTLAPAALGADSPAPAPVSQATPIAVEQSGQTIGTLTTEGRYRLDAFTATISGRVRLPEGFRYRLVACAGHHVIGREPSTQCAEPKTVDLREAEASARVPEVALTVPRPQPGGQAYLVPFAEVTRRAGDGSWTPYARAWPVDGLASAGVAVVARDATTAALPSSQGALLPDGMTGGVDTGRPDSLCVPEVNPLDEPHPNGLSRHHPAFEGAPATYEVAAPTGEHLQRRPRGIVIVIHGGAWYLRGPSVIAGVRSDADRWRARGFLTANIDYRSCERSLTDVLWFYDHARAHYGPALPICVLGASSGGHLALLVAAYRPDVACVVDQAGPTDLVGITTQNAYDLPTGGHQTVGPRWVHNLAVAAFGAENLPAYSPVTLAWRYSADQRLLIAVAAQDPLIPFRQAGDLRGVLLATHGRMHVDIVRLAPGTDVRFPHAFVSQDAFDNYVAREDRLVAGL